MDIQKLENKIKELEKMIDELSSKRINQADILPSVVKARHMGEANRFVAYGLESKLPTGYTVTGSTLCYFAYDTNKLYIWNGSSYKSMTLT